MAALAHAMLQAAAPGRAGGTAEQVGAQVAEQVAVPAAEQDLDALAHIAPVAGRRHVPRGGLITEAGMPAEAVYIIERGQVRVYLLDASGRETTTAVLGSGQVVGIAPLVGAPVHDAFAEALTPVDVLALPACRLWGDLGGNTPLMLLLVGALTQRLALVQGLMYAVSFLPVGERLPDVLARLATLLDGERPQLTHERLGALVVSSRESVTRTVARAERQPQAPVVLQLYAGRRRRHAREARAM